MAKKVSVLIPCFNAEGTIYRAITSVSEGTRAPDEILVYDDKSTDNSVALIEGLLKDIPRLQLIRGEVNRGAGHARNMLLARASGDVFAFLDADDWWYSKKLETQMQMIEREGFDIVTCSYHIYDENLNVVGVRKPIRRIGRFSMHLTNWLATSMTVVRADLRGANMMPNIRRRQDYAYWLNIFRLNGRVRCMAIQDPLGGYLKRKGSLSSGKMENLVANYTMFRQELGYDVVLSFLCVASNVFIRFFRK